MNRRLRWAAAGSVATCVAFSLWAFGKLPERAPVHWDLHGHPNGWDSRWILVLLMPIICVATWVLFELVPSIDPRWRKAAREGTEPEQLGSLPVVVSTVFGLMVALHAITLFSAMGNGLSPVRLMALAFALFMLVFGNFAGRLRPNWFVGIRTPWTLESNTVWRRTHRLAGALMVPGGLLSLVALAVLPVTAAFDVSIVLLVVTLLGPAVASYVFWRREVNASSRG